MTEKKGLKDKDLESTPIIGLAPTPEPVVANSLFS